MSQKIFGVMLSDISKMCETVTPYSTLDQTPVFTTDPGTQKTFKWVFIVGAAVADRNYFISFPPGLVLTTDQKLYTYHHLDDFMAKAISHHQSSLAPHGWINELIIVAKSLKWCLECMNPDHTTSAKVSERGCECQWCPKRYCSEGCHTSHTPHCIKIEVKSVPRNLISNVGVFAKTFIPAGGFIMKVEARWQPLSSLSRWLPKRGEIGFDQGIFTINSTSDMMKMADPFYRPPGPVRHLDQVMCSPESIYQKYSEPNASLNMDQRSRKLMLIASRDIESGAEIFYHWGFATLFVEEINTYSFGVPTRPDANGKLQIVRGELPHGMPRTLSWEYPAFLAYISLRWPNATDVFIVEDDGNAEISVFRAADVVVSPEIKIKVHRDITELQARGANLIWEFHIPQMVFY